MEFYEKEVFFDQYCPKCIHNAEDKVMRDNSDGSLYLDYCDECHDCLNNPSNVNSHKPIHFKEE